MALGWEPLDADSVIPPIRTGAATPSLDVMAKQPSVQKVEVSFVGAPPQQRVERASGVSEVAVYGRVLRCTIHGSFQPFLEALRGHEVVNLRSIPSGE
jgi:hypothetical protein